MDPKSVYQHQNYRRLASEDIWIWLTKTFCKSFYTYYLAAPQPTLSHYQGGSLTHPMLFTAFSQFLTQRSPSPVTSSGISTRVLHIHLQCLDQLGHSPQICFDCFALFIRKTEIFRYTTLKAKNSRHFSPIKLWK